MVISEAVAACAAALLRADRPERLTGAVLWRALCDAERGLDRSGDAEEQVCVPSYVRASQRFCTRCGGNGWYAYDENHGKPCEVCCPHAGWWQLPREGYGDRGGMWACKSCGEVRRDPPSPSPSPPDPLDDPRYVHGLGR